MLVDVRLRVEPAVEEDPTEGNFELVRVLLDGQHSLLVADARGERVVARLVDRVIIVVRAVVRGVPEHLQRAVVPPHASRLARATQQGRPPLTHRGIRPRGSAVHDGREAEVGGHRLDACVHAIREGRGAAERGGEGTRR
jgi:hypothetical protein